MTKFVVKVAEIKVVKEGFFTVEEVDSMKKASAQEAEVDGEENLHGIDFVSSLNHVDFSSNPPTSIPPLSSPSPVYKETYQIPRELGKAFRWQLIHLSTTITRNHSNYHTYSPNKPTTTSNRH